jgi:hypothetical protein
VKFVHVTGVSTEGNVQRLHHHSHQFLSCFFVLISHDRLGSHNLPGRNSSAWFYFNGLTSKMLPVRIPNLGMTNPSYYSGDGISSTATINPNHEVNNGEFYNEVNSYQRIGYLTVACIACGLGALEVALGISTSVCTYYSYIGAWWGSIAVAIGGGLAIASVSQGHAQRAICLAATILAGLGMCGAVAGVIVDGLIYTMFRSVFTDVCSNTLLSSTVIGSFSAASSVALFVYGIYVLCEPPEFWKSGRPGPVGAPSNGVVIPPQMQQPIYPAQGPYIYPNGPISIPYPGVGTQIM